MSRTSVVGPAIGGIVVLPMTAKFASSAGLTDIDVCHFSTPFYVAAATGANAGTTGTAIACDTGSLFFTPSITSNASTLLHMTTNQQSDAQRAANSTAGEGEANLPVPIVGFICNARKADGGVTFEQERFMDRGTNFQGQYPGGSREFFQNATGVGLGVLDTTFHMFLVPMAATYDPDNPATGTAHDPIYLAAND